MNIRPWPPPPNEENKLPEEIGENWEIYVDYLPWVPGMLYQAVGAINACGYLPRRVVKDDGTLQFVYSMKYLMEDHGLSDEVAATTIVHGSIEPDDIFMLIGGHFDDHIFSVLHNDSVKYVSRQAINMHRTVVKLYEPRKKIQI